MLIENSSSRSAGERSRGVANSDKGNRGGMRHGEDGQAGLISRGCGFWDARVMLGEAWDVNSEGSDGDAVTGNDFGEPCDTIAAANGSAKDEFSASRLPLALDAGALFSRTGGSLHVVSAGPTVSLKRVDGNINEENLQLEKSSTYQRHQSLSSYVARVRIIWSPSMNVASIGWLSTTVVTARALLNSESAKRFSASVGRVGQDTTGAV